MKIRTYQRILSNTGAITDLEEFATWMKESITFRHHCDATGVTLQGIIAIKTDNGDIQLKMTFKGEKPVPMRRSHINQLSTDARTYIKSVCNDSVCEDVESDGDADTALVNDMLAETEKQLRGSEPIVDEPTLSDNSDCEDEKSVENPEIIEQQEDEEEEAFDIMSPEFGAVYQEGEAKRIQAENASKREKSGLQSLNKGYAAMSLVSFAIGAFALGNVWTK